MYKLEVRTKVWDITDYKSAMQLLSFQLAKCLESNLATGRSGAVSTNNYQSLIIAWAKHFASILNERRLTIGLASAGYAQVVSGIVPTPPEPQEYLIESKQSNGKSWRNRDKTGRIVMSPMHVAKVQLRFTPGRVQTASVGGPGIRVRITPDIWPAGWVRYGNRVYVDVSKKLFLSVYALEVVGSAIRTYQPVDPVSAGWDVSAERIAKDFIAAELKKDTGMVTSAVAEANRGSLDLLTAAAEMPETIRSIFSGITAISDALKATKKKDIELSKGYKKRKDEILRHYESKLRQINRRRLGATSYERTLLERQAKALAKHKSNAIKKESLAFADAVTSVWMNYRYNIMPNVYLIDDSLDLLANWYTDYVTTRDKVTQDDLMFRIPTGFSGADSFESLHRMTLKRKYKLSSSVSNKLMQLGSANIAVTALELVRLSFVLGWFINLGDVLSAFTAVPVHDEQATSYSQKVEVTERYVGPSGSYVDLTIEGYKREIINPLEFSGLVFDPKITLYRAFDSVALLWPSIKSNLITSKKGK